jgi:hypothetical protein
MRQSIARIACCAGRWPIERHCDGSVPSRQHVPLFAKLERTPSDEQSQVQISVKTAEGSGLAATSTVPNVRRPRFSSPGQGTLSPSEK